MATVNTKIDSITVDEKGVTTAKLWSSNPSTQFQIIVSGWKEWKPTTNPAVLPMLEPGERTLSARSLSKGGKWDPSPATKQFTVPEGGTVPPPDPPPPTPDPGWTTVKTLTKITDWSGGKLIEGLPNATITETGGDIRYYVPGPTSGERCETQTYFGKEGMRCAYDYSILVPAATKLSTAFPGDPKNIITQHHGDKNAGYTGGVSLYPDGRINLRIKGGTEYSMSGSHPYEYENAFDFGTIKRDTRHRVRLEILWHRDQGDARARLDAGPWVGASGIPTWPVGNADGDPTTQIMYRHGWYPQGHIVQGDLDIRFGPLTFQTANG